MRIRRLAQTDVKPLIALRGLYIEAFEEEDSSPPPALSEHIIGAMLSDPRMFFVILETEVGEVVGGITAHLLPNLIQGEPELYLYDLAVHPEFRRRGIASALIRALRNIRDELGASVLYVQAHIEDEEAHALYRKMSSAPEAPSIQFEL
jgi:aminoglycoside 3-N-acetyltransferase I